MSYTERDLSKAFTSLLNRRRPRSLPPMFVYELKVAKRTSLPYSRIEPHQIAALYKAKHDCLTYKISDLSPGEKPFDGFSLCGIPAYLGICFYKPKAKQELIMIEIDDLIKKEKQSIRRSITYQEAKDIGMSYVLEG